MVQSFFAAFKVYRLPLLFSFVVLFFLIFGMFFRVWTFYSAQPLVSRTITIGVPQGASLTQLMSAWQQQGIHIHPAFFKLLTYLHGHTKDLKVGEYRLQRGITAHTLLQKLVTGDVIKYQFTVVEGWTTQHVFNLMRKQPHLQHELTKMNQLKDHLPLKHRSSEGLFYPDTYQFTAVDTDIQIFQRAFNAMQRFLNDEWDKRADNLPYITPYDALTAASIIEKETALHVERPLVSAVICNRLRLHMPLQVDPTVIYGLGKHYKGHLHHRDMKKNTKYNTYIHKGLPPTPIALASAASIHAALHPADSQVLYFVANGDGGHTFSKTLAAQRKAIKARTH